MQITIPASINEAIKELNGIEALLTARGWRRAAIVYAFTRDAARGPGASKTSINRSFSCPEFAELGIEGLTSTDSVIGHRANWKHAIDQGWVTHVEPGDLVDFISLDGKKYPPSNQINSWQRLNAPAGEFIETKTRQVDRLIEEDPEVADHIERRFIQRASHDPALASRIERAFEEFHPTPTVSQERPSERDQDALWSLGSAVYGSVFRERERVGALVSYLERNTPLDEEQMRAAAAVVAGMEAARRQLTSYEDEIRKAMGIDVDATFARLVGEAGGQS